MLTADKIIGRSLASVGGACASLAFIQVLFQQDTPSLPFEISFGAALWTVVGGAVAVKVGLKMSAA